MFVQSHNECNIIVHAARVFLIELYEVIDKRLSNQTRVYCNGIDAQDVVNGVIFGKLGYFLTCDTGTILGKECLVLKNHVGTEKEIVVDAHHDVVGLVRDHGLKSWHKFHRRPRIEWMPLDSNAHVFKIVNGILILSFAILVTFRQMDDNISLSQKRSQATRQVLNASGIGCERDQSLLIGKVLVTRLLIRIAFRILPRQAANYVPHRLQTFNDPRHPFVLYDAHKGRTLLNFLACYNEETQDLNCKVPLEELHFFSARGVSSFYGNSKQTIFRTQSRMCDIV